MDIKITYNPDNLSKISNEVRVTTKFEMCKVSENGENMVIPKFSQRDYSQVEVNNVIYTQRPKRKLSNKSTNSKKSNFDIDKFPKNEMTKHLMTMGYNLEGINYAIIKYKFESIEDAIFILGTDKETGYYNHNFVEMADKKAICMLCRDTKSKHEEIVFNEIIPKKNFDNSDNNLMCEESNYFKTYLNVRPPAIAVYSNLISEIEKDFNDKINLCPICYAEEMSSGNCYTLQCGHVFCKNCVKNYLENLIKESRVIDIKCLQAGCVYKLSDNVINYIVSKDSYDKYLKFKKRQIYIKNINNGMIPCVFPNCEEWISYKEGDNTFLMCQLGHKFCAKCKKNWHKKEKCFNKDLESILKKNSKIKTCPSCYNIIEKIDGCNHMKCVYCHYEFCWLCMGKYTYYHYYVFNVKGCPGMRFANPYEKDSLLSNPFIKCLWYICAFFLGILALVLIFLFFALFGATYELMTCYFEKRHNVDASIEDNNTMPQNNNSVLSVGGALDTENKKDIRYYLIITALVLLGFILQPFYLMLKFIELLLECYRRFGCWLYFYSSY